VVQAERAFGIRTGIAPVDNGNISPRLGLAFDVHGDGSAVARAGIGYFYGRVPYVLGGNVLQTEEPVLTVTCTGALGDPNAPPSPQNYGSLPTSGSENPTSCASAASLSGVPTYTFWSNDFQYPSTLKANLGYEQQLGDRTRATIDVIYSAGHNFYTVQDINLRPAQFALQSEGGRLIFKPEDRFDPTASASTDQFLNTEMSNVFVNYTDGLSRGLTGSARITHRLSRESQVQLSYTYSTAYDNSSYSCCTGNEGWTGQSTGRFGPNDFGGVADTDYMWGSTGYVRNHTFVVNGNTRLPWDFRLSGVWRLSSGRHWTPVISGDINGDGQRFNDRPFIFTPEDLPLATTDPAAAEEARALYAGYLNDHSCIGDYVGKILPRNTCTFPWYNRLDLQVTKMLPTLGSQRAELQVDLFNVLNAINHDWGQYNGIYSADSDLLIAKGFDAKNQKVTYDVVNSFYRESPSGSNLNLQFQAQLAVRYFF
jgi:hypothetical protein